MPPEPASRINSVQHYPGCAWPIFAMYYQWLPARGRHDMYWPDYEVQAVHANVSLVEKDPEQVSRIDPRGHWPQAILDVLSPGSGRMTGTKTIIFRALENE